MIQRTLKLGLDVGSTTVKVVLLDEQNQEDAVLHMLFSDYQRHHADIKASILRVLQDAAAGLAQEYGSEAIADTKIEAALTGSAGLGVANALGIEFVQEVIAETEAINKYNPESDVIIELGGEDAKITYLKPTPEQRMNGSCAGGTGAFIDQMATLLKTDAAGLNKLAENYSKLYPIASRCGVFAKTDLQPLINDGAPPEDLAASIFQAVATQTIAGLACGRPIRGNVIFLGGPLYFLTELREAFKRALSKQVDAFSTPENAQLYVALGAALLANNDKKRTPEQLPTLKELIEKLSSYSGSQNAETKRMEVLFASQDERREFDERHGLANVPQLPIEEAEGAVYLGLDAGSTTIKAALIDQEGNLRYSFYASNEGDPVSRAVEIAREIRSKLPRSAIVARSCVTGYGEGLIKAALHIDEGEVETVAHYRAAKQLAPDVTSIIDIGGQDMKYLSIRDTVIDTIAVNEACSSGCGSFLQTFATTMGKSIQDFAHLATQSQNPVDLGSRCTVFMNSSVKQAQKEGADIGDIAAGLSYSVVRNALYKVIKLRDTSELGEKVVVQGGTFLNDAVLRAFEKLTGLECVRPNISGLMGAFGAALLAKDRYKPGAPSKLLTLLELDKLSLDTDIMNCPFCPNKCNLTVTKFSDGGEYVSGNRCERGLDAPEFGKKSDGLKGPTKSSNPHPATSSDGVASEEVPNNLYKYKYDRTFSSKYYPKLTKTRAKEMDMPYRGVIGIPRTLNIYDNYPFWHTILTKLGFEVKISGRSNHEMFEKGMDSIAAENICYPAKLAHGHVVDLIEKGVDRIFYPCVPFEQDFTPESDNNYNCPIVANYPQVIANNIEQLRGNRKEAKYPKGSIYREHHKNPEIDFIYPYFSLHKPDHVAKRIFEEFSRFGVSLQEAKAAVQSGYEADKTFRDDITTTAKKMLEKAADEGKQVIALIGRPYHVDPEVNHGIPEAIAALDMYVLTEDGAAGVYDTSPDVPRLMRPLRTTDQWAFHSRLYKSAALAVATENLEIVQLNSFGCGLDAVTTDQVADILRAYGKIYTVLKIDEVSNLGAAKIRLRSLAAAVKERKALAQSCSTGDSPSDVAPNISTYGKERIIFTKQMKRDFKILIPQMSPTHFDLAEAVFQKSGYNVELLRVATNEDVEVGLKYVNNDACYPAIMVIGQLIRALKSGDYDVNKTAVMLSQTGGMCRATNYIAMLRMGLASAGLGHIPVVSISTQGLEKNPGFKLGSMQLLWAVRVLIIGDVLSDCLLRTRPYEAQKGAANALYEKWSAYIKAWAKGQKRSSYKKIVKSIVRDFDALDFRDTSRKPRVGVVGEILVKYHPDANNHVIDVIEHEGCEAVLPGIINFMTNKLYIDKWNFKNIGRGSKKGLVGKRFARFVVGRYLAPVNSAFKATGGKFAPWADMREIVRLASQVTSPGVQAGEGWLLAGEVVELVKTGTPNIVVANPFACLPNHVTGRGIFQEIRRQHPEANIVSIDYDPGASQVNQLNRIKLMISAAQK